MNKIIISPSKEFPDRRKTRYVKVHNAKLRIFEEVASKGDTIIAYPEEIKVRISTHFKVLIEESDGYKEIKVTQKTEKNYSNDLENKVTQYEKKEVSPGWYDVINIRTNKSINEKKLREVAASLLVNSLNN